VITADTYRRAAEARVEEARALHEQEHYALAHYVAGLAVECMMYAYLCRLGLPIEKHHDLIRHCSRCRFLGFLPQDGPVTLRVRAAMGDVRARWLNNHRYRDERELLHWLQSEARLDENVAKQKRLRHSSRKIIDAAVAVVTAGRLAWERRQLP